VFSANGGYTSGTAFTSGLIPAAWVGATAVLAAAAAAALLPKARKAIRQVVAPEPELATVS
jgi:hypothetical protein